MSLPTEFHGTARPLFFDTAEVGFAAAEEDDDVVVVLVLVVVLLLVTLVLTVDLDVVVEVTGLLAGLLAEEVYVVGRATTTDVFCVACCAAVERLVVDVAEVEGSPSQLQPQSA